MPDAIDVEFEVSAARAMLDELEAYLASDVLYWQAAPNALGARMPMVTLGGLLEALLRTEAAGSIYVSAMKATLQSIKSRRRSRYLDRAEKEVRSRLDAWTWYLDDYARSPTDGASSYASQVRARFRAELLLGELEPEGRGRAEQAHVEALDARVRGSFVDGAFVWDERLKSSLPPDRYWWLYGRLRRVED